ncbi:hypothetical protein OH491_08250 [Termitidicoccus mucosus]|uniref:hypothetical protein n=1 Tax=Termitidicoccus mucosus TaxID=1184151 RepID=UPI0011AB5AA9
MKPRHSPRLFLFAIAGLPVASAADGAFPVIDPVARPLGLKTCADLGPVTDEVVLAKVRTAQPGKPVPPPASGDAFVFPLFRDGSLLRFAFAGARR